jgi:RNA polymerase sigma-70 factor (ECF subfamily)
LDNNTDIELVKLIRDKNSRNYGFNLLVKSYQEAIYWHIRRIVISHDDTDDLVQETFYKAWKYLDDFREDSKIFTWIYRIATNEALAFVKKQKIKSAIMFSGYEKHIENHLADETFFSGNEIQHKLQKALLKLPEKQRVVFNMKYFEELKYEEISEVLGTSVGALKASYHFAVKKIEKYLIEG